MHIKGNVSRINVLGITEVQVVHTWKKMFKFYDLKYGRVSREAAKLIFDR